MQLSNSDAVINSDSNSDAVIEYVMHLSNSDAVIE